MDIILLILFISLYCCGVWALLWAANEINNFLKRHREITDLHVLEKYKSLARHNMYMALVQLFTLSFGSIAGLVLISRNGGAGLFIVIIGNTIIIVLGQSVGTLERQVRSLPCADDSLAKTYRRISKTWVKKALPDF